MDGDLLDQALKRRKSVQSFFEICVIERAWSNSSELSKISLDNTKYCGKNSITAYI
jgi:hypothetical protein